jgi:methionyl-tRNA formyltransferase
MYVPSKDTPSPIRVVVFTGGPTLRPGIQRFIGQLEDHPQIDLLAVYCQSQGHTLRAVMADLWRRRKGLALPLMIMHVGQAAGRYLFHPGVERALKRRMDALSNRIHFVPDIHAMAVLEAVRRLAPDLGLIYGSPILKPALFQIPACGTLGIHHGKLPDYRGKKTTFWAMYNGESTAGVTIQKVNARLDAGEIVKEGAVPTAGRSLRAVWRALEQLGFTLYLQAILEIREGTATYRPPQGEKGKLYRDPKWKDILRFWSKQLKGIWHNT